MSDCKRLSREFYTRDVLKVAPALLSKILVIAKPDGTFSRFLVTETEAYRGSEDLACHACRGRTPRTEVMFHNGGLIYVYLVYGIHWMLNVVTGTVNEPQAVLIRSIEGYTGPGRLTRILGIDGSFYGEDLISSKRIWFEDSTSVPVIKAGERIGIDYAGDYWRRKPWRFYF